MSNDHAGVKDHPDHAHDTPKDGTPKKPMSEQATHQGGGGVNKDHKPHGGGPIPKGQK